MILLNPKNYQRQISDDRSRELMQKTIQFFEDKGLDKLKEDFHERTWYADFIEFMAKNQVLRVTEGIEKEYRVAQRNEQNVADRLAEAKTEATQLNRKEFTLRELPLTGTTYRKLLLSLVEPPSTQR